MLKDFEKQNNPTIPAAWYKNRQHGKSIDLRIAECKDIPALAKLYTVCFGDKTAEAEHFLHIFFQNSDARLLLAEKDKTPISMLAMVPARLSKEETTFYRCFYLYGIGTLPVFRNQGLSRTLMDCAKALASSLSYDYLFLVPASRSLISFYEEQGFLTMPVSADTNSPLHSWKLSGPLSTFPLSSMNSSASSDFAPISLSKYLALRTNLENTAGTFSLLEPFHTYALEVIAEQLHFYQDMQTQCGLCFYDNKKEPFCKLLEQTEPSSPMSGGLLHQIFPLRSHPVPDYTYFQFPMDDLL